MRTFSQRRSFVLTLVSLGSQVEFRDEQTGKIQEIILVYPFDADIARRRVSVLTPVGAALLGLSVNQTISIPHQNQRKARIDSVQSQSGRLGRDWRERSAVHMVVIALTADSNDGND